VKGYVRNTINLSWDKILLTSVFGSLAYVCSSVHYLKSFFNELEKFSYSVPHQLVMRETNQLHKQSIKLQPTD
jgi:hypothetical protein